MSRPDDEFEDEWDEGWTGLDTALLVLAVLCFLSIVFAAI